MEAQGTRWRIEELLGESSWLSALATALVADRGLAQDVVQDTWAAALRSPPERGTPVRPWLARVARNVARQRLRGEARRERREQECVLEREHRGPDELAARLEGQRLLVEAIGELDEPYRSTVLWIYFEHRSAGEVASLTGVAASTVRWRLKQALDELRARLDRRSNGERGAWALALVPLARSAPEGGAAAGFFGGLLAMGIAWKLAAGAAAAALALVGLSWSGVLELPFLPTWAGGGPPAVEVTFAPLPPKDTAPIEGTLAPEREPVARADAGVRVEPPVEQAEALVHVRARFLDPNDAPIAGVELKFDTRAQVRSDARGEAEIALHLGKYERTLKLVAEREGFATRALELQAQNGHSYELGDVRLALGGAIVGTITDIHGAPVPDAHVGLMQLNGAGYDLEVLRRLPFSEIETGGLRSDAQGNFRLPGVEAGHRVLCVEHASFLRTISGAIEVRAGQESRGVLLVLEPIPDSERVEGVVLAADGAPEPYALLRWAFHSGRAWSGTLSADEHGRFAFIVRDGERLDLMAKDRSGHSAQAQATNLVGGQLALVLRLGSSRTFAIEVRDAQEAPIETFQAWTEIVEDPDHLVPRRKNGRAELTVPAQPFALVVEADGFRIWRSELLDPLVLPDTYVVHLERMPVLAGHVRDASGLVPDAQVSVLRMANTRVVMNGFPTRVQPGEGASTTSDAQGAFRLTVREAQRMLVRCTHVGYAPAELGPFDYDPKHGLEGLELLLSAGGTIEGRVVPGPGERAAGAIVAFSRGDGLPFTVRVGEDGAYRVEHLTPGPWMVARVERELIQGEGSWGMGRGDAYDAVPSVCTVVEGQTTHFDLAMASAEPTFAIDGVVTIEGAPANGWEVARVEGELLREQGARKRLDLSGRFLLEAPKAGPVSFVLTAHGVPFDGLHLIASTEVRDARTTWSADLRQATLVIDVPEAADPARPWALVVAVAPGLNVLIEVPQSAGEHTLMLPAGRAKLVLVVDPESLGTDPGQWPAQSELVLVPGATGRLRRP